MSRSLSVEWVDQHVACLVIDQPPRNFFDLPLLKAIADTVEDIAQEGARAAILKSRGTVFCAGADFGDSGDVELAPEALYEQAVRLFRRRVPIVAQIQGAAMGGGVGLALAADFRVGSPRARFGVNFVQIGIHHGFGIGVTLPRVVGEQAALDLLLTGRRIDGAEALRLGLLDRLVAEENLEEETIGFALELAAGAPLAVQAVRSSLLAGLIDQVEAAVVHEATQQRILFGTEDFKEGVRSVSERRPGRFVGR